MNSGIVPVQNFLLPNCSYGVCCFAQIKFGIQPVFKTFTSSTPKRLSNLSNKNLKMILHFNRKKFLRPEYFLIKMYFFFKFLSDRPNNLVGLREFFQVAPTSSRMNEILDSTIFQPKIPFAIALYTESLISDI